jgi:hypothetical protein
MARERCLVGRNGRGADDVRGAELGVVVELLREVQPAHPSAIALAVEADERPCRLWRLLRIRPYPLDVRIVGTVSAAISHCLLRSLAGQVSGASNDTPRTTPAPGLDLSTRP